MSEDKGKTFRVPDANLPELQSRIAKLNKRGAKLGCDPIVLNITGHEDVPERKRDTLFPEDEPHYYETGRILRYHLLTVSGQAPKVNGWTFIGKLQFIAANGENEAINLLKAVPGYEFPEQYRNASPENCDHCHTRRRRNDTFILASECEPVTYKQVGRNCLADFLGHTSPETYAAIAEIMFSASDLCGMAEDEGFGGGCNFGRDLYEVETFLTWTSAAIRQSGWLSRKAASESNKQATVDDVVTWKMTRTGKTEKPFVNWTVEESDKKRAAATLEWMRALPLRPELNDYLFNLSTIGSLEVIDRRMFGLTASAIAAYMREEEKEIERRKRAEINKDSHYFGEIGKREVFTLTLEWMREFNSQFGVTTLYKFRDEAGNVACWFASNPLWVRKDNSEVATDGSDIEVGQTVTVKATVKKHEERDGIKQTMLTRVALYTPKATRKVA